MLIPWRASSTAQKESPRNLQCQEGRDGTWLAGIVNRPEGIPERLWDSSTSDVKIMTHGLCEEIRELKNQIGKLKGQIRDISAQAKQTSSLAPVFRPSVGQA